MQPSQTTRFPAAGLHRLGARIFSAVGTPPDIATEVARALVDANLAGHDSHGVIRIPEYVARVQSGAIYAAARPSLALDRQSAALTSGNWGFGQVAGAFAIDQGVTRAREHGVAVVGLVRCNHLGRIGNYMERAVTKGCIAMAWVGGLGGAHQAVPYGGTRPVYGTNPVAAGFPAGEAGMVIVDFATTAIAGGKAMVAHAVGETVPPGSIVDRDGRPTTDPVDFLRGGALLPFGGHKGYALAVLAELLGQIVTGADETGDEGGGGDPFRRAGALFVVIDAGVFRPREQVASVAAQTIQRIRAVPPVPGVDRVMTPGDPEAYARKRRDVEGIPVPNETWQAISTVAVSLGISVDDLRDSMQAGATQSSV